MSEEFKQKLYAYFLEGTPIKYDSVTDEQWQAMRNTTAGASIALSLAFKPLVEAFTELGKRLNKAVADIAKALRIK